MAKQPYIPLYIGDWEQDTNCLSIEAEGAWLKVVFKCWKNAGVFTCTTAGLARLCKVDCLKFASILLEWKMNDICEIQESEDGIITITSRRIKREAQISAVRADSGSKGGSKTQAKCKAKPQAKTKQIPDIDNEIDSEVELKKESASEIDFTQPDVPGDDITLPFETEPMRKLWAAWKEARWRNHRVRYAIMGEQADLRRLQGMSFNQIEQTIQQAISGNWKNLYPEKNGKPTYKTRQQKNTDDLVAGFAARYGSDADA